MVDVNECSAAALLNKDVDDNEGYRGSAWQSSPLSYRTTNEYWHWDPPPNYKGVNCSRSRQCICSTKLALHASPESMLSGGCIECSSGKYNDEHGQTGCKVCEEGKPVF